jgi:Short C-terminal domain
MFRKRNLLKQGATAKAVVVEADRRGGRAGESGSTPTQYYLKLRVHFDDGSTAEADTHVGGFIRGTDLMFGEGDIVPVRYDEDDRSQVEVDVPALETERDAKAQALHDQSIARAEAELTGGGSTPDSDGVLFTSAAEDRRQRKEQARAARERQKARRAAQLEKLTRKHEQGLISDEEFAAKKANLQGGS